MLAEAPVRAASTISGDWVLWLGTERQSGGWKAATLGRYGQDLSLRARLGEPEERPLLSVAHASGVSALIDGFLNDTPAGARGDRLPQTTPAEILLSAYTSTSGNYLSSTRGTNARVVVDSARQELIAVRDPIGVQPLFYTTAVGGVAVSPSIDALLALPGVSHDVSRAALADHLCGRWPDPQETYYTAVRRVPAGHLLRWHASGRFNIERYWDPYPEGRPIPWLRRDEIGLFDQRFEQAVARCLVSPATGIFLSGGLDSVSVAALAVDQRRRKGQRLPLALSLGFPHTDCDEEAIQRGVASGLEMRSEFLPFGEAVGARGLIAQALEMCPTLPSPMMHTWNPAYAALTRRARDQGIETILTGGGGDEWLSISPNLAADYIRSGNIVALARFMRMWQRSYPLTPIGLVRSGLWRFGLRPLASMWLGRLAPTWWHRRRGERLVATTPAWVAADPALRRLIDDRAIGSMQPTDPPEGFYLGDVRRGIAHPLTSMEFEESELFSRRHGVRTMRPFFDVDLVELLYRTPPELLTLGGRAKGLVRDAVARRFPGLGFERQKKKAATQFFRSLLRDELPALWADAGGPRTLISMGVVEPAAVEQLRQAAFSGTLDVRLYRTWSILNLEHWARTRVTG
jgi:asparagine synthase (glutamine-hydrolysing)